MTSLNITSNNNHCSRTGEIKLFWLVVSKNPWYGFSFTVQAYVQQNFLPVKVSLKPFLLWEGKLDPLFQIYLAVSQGKIVRFKSTACCWKCGHSLACWPRIKHSVKHSFVPLWSWDILQTPLLTCYRGPMGPHIQRHFVNKMLHNYMYLFIF